MNAPTAASIKLGVIPGIDQYINASKNAVFNNSKQNNSTPSVALGMEYAQKSADNEKPHHKKMYDFSYATGVLNTGLQVASGAMLLGLSLFGKKKPGNPVMENMFDGKSAKLYKAAAGILGWGYFIGFPSVTGAGIKAEQPSLVLASYMWFLLSPLMILGKLTTRTRAFLTLAYAPAFSGFANQINNYKKADNDKSIRKQDLDYMLDKETYTKAFSLNKTGKKIREKLWNFTKFCFWDQVTSFKVAGKAVIDTSKQSWNYFTGKSNKLPDVISTKPSKESMSLGNVFILAGSIPKIIGGAPYDKSKILNIFLGAGLLFETIGMMTLANTKQDSRKPALLVGGPMRLVGDFGQNSPFLYGLRTLGGASFEWYWTLMNKDKKGEH